MSEKRAICYCRVSTDEQAGNYSLPTQLEACRKYAEKNDFVIVGEFSDDYSGATPIEARPEGRKAFTMLKSSEADCLIAYSMDRIARPPEEGDEWDMPNLIRGLAKLGKELHTVNRGPLKTDFASLLIAMMDARSAGEERRKITERTNRGKNAKAQNGRVVGNGHPPYGYRFQYQYDERRRKNVAIGLEIDEDESPIIRDIFDWYTKSQLSFYLIAKRLSEQAIPTSGESRKGTWRKREAGLWSAKIVRDFLDNPVYIGCMHYGKDDIIVQVPPIIDRLTWEATRKRREEKNVTSHRKNEYLLSGRILCGCGRHFTGRPSGGIPYYSCSSYGHRITSIEERTCHERTIRAAALDNAAWDFALQSKKSAAEFMTMLKEYQEQQKKDAAPLAEQIAGIKTLLDTTARKIKRLASLRGSASDDDEAEQYTADLEAAKADKVTQERKLHKLESEYNWMDTLTDDDILTVHEIRERDLKQLQGATFEEKRRYLAKIDLCVTIKDGVVTFSSMRRVSKQDVVQVPIKQLPIVSRYSPADSAHR